MKAFAVTSPGRLDTIHLPVPELGPFDVLCRMQYGTVCAGTDARVVAGQAGPGVYPAVIGHESIGQVVLTGHAVRSFREGDYITRVGLPPSTDGSYHLAWGGMAEMGIARDHAALRLSGARRGEWFPYRVHQVIPSTLMEPALMPMFVTWRETLSYAHRIGFAAGTNVLISGTGASGLSFAAMARALGAPLVAVVGSESRRAAALAAGADLFVSYRDAAEVDQLVKDHRNRFNILVDATGIPASINRLLPALREGGTIGNYGLDDPDNYAINPTLAHSFTFYNGGYDEPETHWEVIDLVQHGKLDARHWIDPSKMFDWSNIPAAFAAAQDRSQIKPLINLHP
ncbi:MAG: zinc-binding dehydrogenase [Bifidobacteriaceae bacterium]|jgi:2-desacetyl-2-hydroxyethyl bacteriochlorophyllide A dehydrogenase|nr:zinc-binding dehydrogenase [Bifidobacteriaceae bacterium]